MRASFPSSIAARPLLDQPQLLLRECCAGSTAFAVPGGGRAGGGGTILGTWGLVFRSPEALNKGAQS